MTSDDREELIKFLQEHGWSREKSEAAMDDTMGIRLLQIPGKCLLDVLKEVTQEGIPTGTIQVAFLVPGKGWDAFKKRAEVAIAKHGGFVFTPEEKAALANVDPETVH
jgi:hypothetical protein